MNTHELIEVFDTTTGTSSIEEVIWCDIDGWGDTVRRQGFPSDPYHFCSRHSADEVRDFIEGRLMGYFEGQLDLI